MSKKYVYNIPVFVKGERPGGFILDTKKKEAQEEWLDNVSLQTIAD